MKIPTMEDPREDFDASAKRELEQKIGQKKLLKLYSDLKVEYNTVRAHLYEIGSKPESFEYNLAATQALTLSEVLVKIADSLAGIADE